MKPSLDILCLDNVYDVKNSIETRGNDRIVSFDVKSLFTNIPLKCVYRIINEEWSKIEPPTKIKNTDIYLIRLLCENGFFKFNNEIFWQLGGVHMGGVTSVNIAGIVMNRLLDKALVK